MIKSPRDMTENELRYHCAVIDAEIERLRAALYDAREYVEHQVKTTGTVWAQDRLNKIDAALGRDDQQRAEAGK